MVATPLFFLPSPSALFINKEMLLPIAQLGQPVLRQVAAEVPVDDILTPAVQQLLRDMHETLRQAEGTGLAAPQVFESRRIFLAAILPPPADDAPPQIEVFINPRLLAVSAETADAWEGCLSFPELLVRVPRAWSVRVAYCNARAESCLLELSDFPARVIQHEFDHLQGILTLDRALSSHHIIKASEIEAVRMHPI
jgi:peptide deformylase